MNKTYRSSALLKLANEIPCCVRCYKPNEGDVVAAHYQGIRSHLFGKGRGIKPTDIVTAYLCAKCHQELDTYSNDEESLIRSEEFMFYILITSDWVARYRENEKQSIKEIVYPLGVKLCL